MCIQFESCSLQPSPVEHKCQKLQHLRTLTRKLLPVAASEISYDLWQHTLLLNLLNKLAAFSLLSRRFRRGLSRDLRKPLWMSKIDSPIVLFLLRISALAGLISRLLLGESVLLGNIRLKNNCIKVSYFAKENPNCKTIGQT